MPRSLNGWILWCRWIVANALAEMLGLGLTFAIAVAIFAQMADAQPAWTLLALNGLMVLAGSLEGLLLGIAQSWAITPYAPRLSKRCWTLATLLGTLAAWFLGMLPSTIMGLLPSSTPTQPLGDWVILLLAVAMGALLGWVLALPQWWLLRQLIPRRAWQWLPANSIAWAVGMPIIFMGVDAAQAMTSLTDILGGLAITLAATGAVVGAIHGVVLVRLASV